MSDGWHLDRYDTGYQHGWVEAIEACLDDLQKLENHMSNWSSDETTAALLAFPELTAAEWTWAQRGLARAQGEIRRLLEEASQP